MSKVVFLLALLAACYTGLEWYSYTPLDQNQTHSIDQWDHDENMQALWWIPILFCNSWCRRDALGLRP